MYCKNCGFPYPDGSRFCQNCGQPIDQEKLTALSADMQGPAANTQQPAAPVHQPDAMQVPGMVQQPDAMQTQSIPAQQPAANMQQPYGMQAPGAYMQQPVVMQNPAAAAQQPVTQQPAANMQQPYGMQPPAPGMAPNGCMQPPMPGMESNGGIQDPAVAEAVRRVEQREYRKRTRHVFSRIGWAFILIYLGTALSQVVVVLILRLCGVDVNGTTTAYWLASFLPQYLIGFPLGYLLLRGLPVSKPEPEQLQKFSPAKWLKLFVIAVFIGYGSSFVSSILGSVLQKLLGTSGDLNVLDSLFTDDSVLLEILFAVIIAPVVEELFFRKLIIDRTRGYGERLAVLYSALVFGLFHGNLTQSIYAFALGLLLGYIYMRSGKLHYSIGIHMAFNFIGSVVSSVLLEKASMQMSSLGISEDMTSADFDRILDVVAEKGVSAVGWLLGYGFFMILLFGLMIAGLVLLIINLKRLKFYETAQQLQPGHRAKLVWGNAGMIVFTVLLLIVMAITFFAAG